MSYGLIATLIVLAIVIGAITTKKCEAFLIAGSMVGAIVLWKQDFLTKWVSTLEGVISDEAYVILICGLFGSLVALLTASRGSFGFTKIVTKICNTERKTLFATFILGILIFVDDYLNVLSIGTAMKGSYDKKKVPRELCINTFFIMGSIFWSYFLTAGLCKGSCRWKPYEDIPDGYSILCLPDCGTHNSISFLHGLVSKAWWHEKGIRASCQNWENI